MKTAEQALKEWTLNRVRFNGGREYKVWDRETFRVLFEAFRKLDGGVTIVLAVGQKSAMRAQVSSLVDWFQAEVAFRIIQELNLFHLLTPLWLAQCGSWKGVAVATRKYRQAEELRKKEAEDRHAGRTGVPPHHLG